MPKRRLLLNTVRMEESRFWTQVEALLGVNISTKDLIALQNSKGKNSDSSDGVPPEYYRVTLLQAIAPDFLSQLAERISKMNKSQQRNIQEYNEMGVDPGSVIEIGNLSLEDAKNIFGGAGSPPVEAPDGNG